MFNNYTDREFLVVSDIDNTLVGDGKGLEVLSKVIEPIRSKIVLAYNSGRSTASQRQSLHLHRFLPNPDFLIGNIGTEIEHFVSGAIDTTRDSQIINWDREKLKTTVDKLGFTIQPEKFQSNKKLSYYAENSPNPINELEMAIHRENLDAEIVYSSNRDLDLLPKGFNKGSAVKYLQSRIDIDNSKVIVAGDSKNDLSMFKFHYKGIVVNNATDGLKKAVDPKTAYFSQFPFAHGVVDGLYWWKVLKK